MIKCLFGEEKKLIESYINKLINENDYEVIKYDFNDENIIAIENELSYSDFFGMKKLIIINNCDFLSSKEENKLNKYLVNSDIDIILTCDKINEKNEIIKYLKERKDLIEFPKLTKYNIEAQVRKDVEEDGYKIDNLSIKKLVELCSNEYSIITNELKKIEYYKIYDKNITIDDVNKLVSKNNDDIIFKLVDAINTKDTRKILEYYNTLILEGTDPLLIISMIGNNFRLLLQIKLLLTDNLNTQEIATLLNVNKYRLDIMSKKSYNFTIEELKDSLSSLFDLEYEIKSGNQDKNSLVQLFLLSKYSK